MGSVITGIYDAAQAARHTSNDRLQGALALKAGYDAYKLANGGVGTALKAEDTMNALNKASTEASKGTVNNNSAAFAVSATVGSNSSSQDSSSNSTTQRDPAWHHRPGRHTQRHRHRW